MIKPERICVFFFVLVFSLLTSKALMAQQVFKTTPTSVISYYEYVPQNYNSNSDKYPIVIFLHGLGERGPNTTDIPTLESAIINVAKNGPPRHVKNGAQFPFILISPQLKNNYGDWPSAYVMEVINYVKTYLRIDEKRIYITGLSLGGGGTWWLAQDYPKLFASIAPVCGSRNTPTKACLLSAENLPVWAFHNDGDPTVPSYKSVNMVNAINNCVPAPDPKAILTLYSSTSHNAWDKAYALDHTYHNPNLYEWMMSKTNTINGGNKIPTASAGTDLIVSSTSALINGSGSDVDGTIASYQWTKMNGGNATLTNSNTKSLSLSNLATGDYVFRLTVTDSNGDTDSDYIKLTVQATTNVAPVANAGKDQIITLPATASIVTGTGTDADGTISSYAWTQVSGPAKAILTNATTPKMNVSGLTLAGFYVFKLTVTDNNGATAYDRMAITVNADPGGSSAIVNAPPTASAGADVTITLPVNSTSLVGKGTDTDGNIASYSWTKIAGGTATMAGTTTSTLNLSMLVSGTYTFRLTVQDNTGATAYDDVVVTVISQNILPTAYAGKDMTIYLPTTTATVVGSGKDTDGTIAAFSWRQVSGPVPAVLNNSNTSTLNLSGLTKDGFYVFQLTVTDNSGGVASDKMGLYVKIVTAVAASAMEEEVQVIESLEVNEISEPITLDETSNQYWDNKSVVIYNENGKRLYAGLWNADSYEEVFQVKGMYIYNVMQGGKRIDAGKIVIKD